MTGPRIDVPAPQRILSPDEFEHAQVLSPSQLAQAKFPIVPPPFAPRDATRVGPEQNDQAKPLTGLPRILTQYIAAPIMDHPLSSAAISLIPGAGVAMAGLMGKDILEYAAQKSAEMSLSPEDRARAEADPERIPGERAAVEGVMLGAAPLVHGALNRAKGSAPARAPATDAVLGPPVNGKSIATAHLPEHVIAAATQAKDGRVFVGNMHSEAVDASFAAAGGERFSGLPVTSETRAVIGKHVDAVTDAWLTIVSPSSRSPEALTAANILRATTGEMAGQYEQAAFKLDQFRRSIEPLPDADKLGFIDAIEGGESQASPEFQAAADIIRKTLDETREHIRELGTGKLEHFIEDYFPHIWKDAERAGDVFKTLPEADALESAKISTGGKRPFEGSRSFLKKRTIPTTAEGMALGLEPVTTNPVDLTLLKLREMLRYLTAHTSLNEMKEAGLVKFVRAGEQAPEGYQRINDKIATVFGKPTVTVKEAFDAGQRASIETAIEQLGGVSHERKVSLGRQKGLPAGTLGYARGDTEVVSKFGTHDGVIMHELGHIVDNRYGLQAKFASAKLGKELTALASLRAESTPDAPAKFLEYIQKPEEQAANALHAFLHAPERMADVAPKTKKFLERFLAAQPETAAILDIKPSLELKSGTAEVPVGGLVIMGEHWAPESVAKIVNNHLSPGLRGNAIYDAYRGLGNTLNQAQLGLSAFHLGFTSMDASVSRAALGVEYLASGKPLKGLSEILSTPVAPVTNAFFGRRIRAAYLNPEGAPPDMVALANAVKEAGGRVRQDSFYKNSAPEKMIAAWKDGEYGKAAAYSVPALFEYAARPLMEHIVPMQKLGVFGDLATKVLADLPPEATLAERRGALAKAWDSVDNRMGQLVYDNLFWSKSFKDMAMASVRSVGWNVGTIRELGGGAFDLTAAVGRKATGNPAELSHRAAYVVALPITVGLYGATYQYLRTGDGPAELKDYFYPKTGEVDADGNPERVQMASYMKDMFAYAGHPWETVKHKMSPILSSVYEMLQNEDFYGDMIRNPEDPAVVQVKQEAEYVVKQAIPFSFRNAQENSARGDQSNVTKFGNWFGVTPAPRREVRSDAQNRMADFLASRRVTGATPEDAEAQKSRAEILSGLRGNSSIELQDAITNAIERHQLTAPDLARLLKRAGTTPAQEKFKRLTVPQAIEVFKLATDAEKAKFAGLLVAKIEKMAPSARVAVQP